MLTGKSHRHKLPWCQTTVTASLSPDVTCAAGFVFLRQSAAGKNGPCGLHFLASVLILFLMTENV